MKNNDFISKNDIFEIFGFLHFRTKIIQNNFITIFRKFCFKNFDFFKISKKCFLSRIRIFEKNVHFYMSRYLPAKFEAIWLEEEPTD